MKICRDGESSHDRVQIETAQATDYVQYRSSKKRRNCFSSFLYSLDVVIGTY